MSVTFSDELNKVLNQGIKLGLIQQYYVQEGKLIVQYYYVDQALEVSLSRSNWDNLASASVSSSILGFTSALLKVQHEELNDVRR